MALIYFSKTGYTNWTPTGNPGIGFVEERSYEQSQQRTAGGKIYVYQHGGQFKTFRMHWPAMSSSDLANLLSWWDDPAEAMKVTFTYYDEVGSSHTVRFNQPKISKQYLGNSLFRVEFELVEEV